MAFKRIKKASKKKAAAAKRTSRTRARAKTKKSKNLYAIATGGLELTIHGDEIITVGHKLGVHDERAAIGIDQIEPILSEAEKDLEIRKNAVAVRYMANLKVNWLFAKGFTASQYVFMVGRTATNLAFYAGTMVPLVGSTAFGAAQIAISILQVAFGVAANVNMNAYKLYSLQFFNLPIGINDIPEKKQKQINTYLGKILTKVNEEKDKLINNIELIEELTNEEIKKNVKKEFNDYLKELDELEEDSVAVYADLLEDKNVVCDFINSNINSMKILANEELDNALNCILELNYDEIIIINDNIENDILLNDGKCCARSSTESYLLFHNQRIKAKRKEYFETYKYDPEMLFYISDILDSTKHLFLNTLSGFINIDMDKVYELYENDKNLSQFVVDEYNSFKSTLKDEIDLLIDNHLSDDIDEIKNDVKDKMILDSDNFTFDLDEEIVNNFYNMLGDMYKKMKYVINQEFRDRFKSVYINIEDIDMKEYNKVYFKRAFFKILNKLIDLHSSIAKKIVVDEVNPYEKLRSFEIIKIELEELYLKNIEDSNSLLINNIEKIDNYEINDKEQLKDVVDIILNLPNVNIGLYEEFKIKIKKEEEIIIENVVKVIQGFVENVE